MTQTNPIDSDELDTELEVLQSIYAQSEHVRQRDLAKVVGLSLGMTNAIVKRLVQKGWLSVRKFNSRNIRYAVSPSGIEQIMRRSYRYFKRTIRNIVEYRDAVDRFIRSVKAEGYTGIMLFGASDLDFIVQHSCGREGMDYVTSEAQAAEVARKGLLFTIYSESFIPNHEDTNEYNPSAFLQEIVSGT